MASTLDDEHFHSDDGSTASTRDEDPLISDDDTDEDNECSSQASELDVNGRHRFFACYLLVSQSARAQSRNRTYIGFTVNPARRIRQHNGELKGAGAKRTSFHRP